MGFHWSFRDNKSPQVSRTLLSILAVLSNTVIWIVSTRPPKLMISLWSRSDSTYPQISRTLLSILADLNNVVVWMVSTFPLISKSSSHCTNSLMTVPSAQNAIGFTVTFKLHRFSVLKQSLSIYLSFRFLCYHYYYYYLLLRVFNISLLWWSFTGVWVTSSLLKSTGLFSVIWPFSIM